MSRESTEELRQRLLRDERVRELISRRAYEIYVMRGGRPGGEGHDWFQAESEILSILIEEESRRADESAGTGDKGAASLPADDQPVDEQPVDETSIASPVGESLGIPETSDRMEQPSGLTAEERAESQSALSTWSATEPASSERAPVIGHADELQTGAQKKARARAAAKPASARKSKLATEKSTVAKEPAAKASTAKASAEKAPPAKESTGRKATAKPAEQSKSAEPSTKMTKSRKKTKE